MDGRPFKERRRALTYFAACLLGLGAILAGCGQNASSGGDADATVHEKSSSATSTNRAETPTSGKSTAILRALGNSGISGTATYVKRPSNPLPLLELRLQGLEPASGEKQYAFWQMRSRHAMLSLATYHVPSSGRLSVELEPSPESIAFLEDGSKTQFLVTKVNSDDRMFELNERSPSAEDPAFIGAPVARGTVTGPFVGTGSAE